MDKVAVVGVGTIGRAWAISFARNGFQVALNDQSEQACEEAIRLISASLNDLEKLGLINSPNQILAHISLAPSIDSAIDQAIYVQESIVEDRDAKRALYEKIDELDNGATLYGSSTSALPGSTFLCGLKISPRAMVVHPTNPPHIVPLTELCVTPETSNNTSAVIRKLMEQIGQVPILINKEIDGFILNRLQAAVVTEALHLVGEGYISPEDLDATMTSGLGLRWSFMGPFMTGHLNSATGYARYMQLYGDLYRDLALDLKTDYEATPELFEIIDSAMAKTIPNQQVSHGQRWRDQRIAALARHQSTQPSASDVLSGE